MTRILRNPWTPVLLVPLALFVLLVLLGVTPDSIVLAFGFLLFLVVSVAASKYALRAPALIWSGNIRNDSANIVGWGLVLLSLMATQIFRWVFILLERPEWLVQSYWSASFVYTMFLGFVLVAYSTRRTTPKPPSGRIGLGGFFVGFLTAVGLMLSGILPTVTKFVIGLFAGALHAL